MDILRWLEEDADSGFDARLQRDREIGRALPEGDDLDRVLGWWQQVRSQLADDPTSGDRLAALARIATLGLTLLGLLLGISLGSVAFAYDGTHPVNVLALLGVLVGVPLVLFILTLIYLLPGRIPGLGALRDSVATLNPGRWAGAWLDRYAGMKLFAGFGDAGQGFGRWQLLVFSQWVAVGYFAGVVIAGLVLVAVSDLAFGWSSTLDLDTEGVHAAFAFFALPWQGWLPGAVPDLELVAGSRYYRLETQAVSVTEAAALGAWWPFVLMTILIWGLAPRLLLLGFGSWRRRLALRELLCRNPEVLALLDRLRPPHVDFGPELPEESGMAGVDKAAAPPLSADGDTGVLIWNQSVAEEAAGRWLTERLGVAAGLSLSLSVRDGSEGWAATLNDFLGGRSLKRLVIFSKGWEPPLLEFSDFLEALRASIGDAATLVVVPINTRGDGVEPGDREIWAEFLGRHGDPRLYVMEAS
ncbi:MAG: DUF2868 domain-containing protein [Gammaproteobacteria bacterium]|nr:MAG: DUF2868 domain-containing protein [Gammaproteobacteria bacterium]